MDLAFLRSKWRNIRQMVKSLRTWWSPPEVFSGSVICLLNISRRLQQEDENQSDTYCWSVETEPLRYKDVGIKTSNTDFKTHIASANWKIKSYHLKRWQTAQQHWANPAKKNEEMENGGALGGSGGAIEDLRYAWSMFWVITKRLSTATGYRRVAPSGGHVYFTEPKKTHYVYRLPNAMRKVVKSKSMTKIECRLMYVCRIAGIQVIETVWRWIYSPAGSRYISRWVQQFIDHPSDQNPECYERLGVYWGAGNAWSDDLIHPANRRFTQCWNRVDHRL